MTTQTPGEAIVSAEMAERLAAKMARADTVRSGFVQMSHDFGLYDLRDLRTFLAAGLPQRVRELEYELDTATKAVHKVAEQRDALEARLQEAELQLQDEKTAYRLLSEQWNRCDIERAALARNQP